jgi:energy-coupling factor transporter ATP-binding protein EcfA2
MSKEVVQKIVEWADDKLPWHRDAIRRIYQNGALTHTDIDQLELMCLTQGGVEFAQGTSIPTPAGLTQNDIGEIDAARESVSLKQVSDAKRVNRLAENQTVTFGETGLTVIYGDNGSGKSGYSRILRQVCRARSKTKDILTNVFEDPPAQPPSAKIEYKLGNTARTTDWVLGHQSPAELSNISLFDSECASVHVTEENTLAFTPQGLDILPKLADVLRAVQSRLRAKLAGLETTRPASLSRIDKYPDTRGAQMIDELRPETNLDQVRRFSERSVEERARQVQLVATLSQNPLEQAKLLQARKLRLIQLKDICTRAVDPTSNQSAAELRVFWEASLAAQAAAKLAAEQLFTGEALPLVGSESWRFLWEAARRYSELEAYTGRNFPFVGEAAKCVLCQQALSQEAIQRMVRFEDYVKGETRRAAEDAGAKLRETMAPLLRLASGPRDTDGNLRELALESEELRDNIRRLLMRNRWRRRAILRNCGSNQWKEIPIVPTLPTGDLQRIIDSVDQRCRDSIQASQSGERVALQKELLELQAREWLETHIQDVESEVRRLTQIQTLQSCLRNCDTTGVTRKNNELTDEFVTDALKASFVSELQALGLTYLNVTLNKVGGEYGASKYQVQLTGVKQNASIGKVLSEGEYRGIGLAAFLAELATSPSKSALIFDDPVSSLDHNWRQRIADRLAAEARHRQVIVFTHDLVFLHGLLGSAEKLGIEPVLSHFIRGAQGAGVSLDGVPWVAMPVKKRIGYLKQAAQKAEAEFRSSGEATYEPMGRHIYGLLRETWERAIEEILLGQVVTRFGREVQTSRLRYTTDIKDQDIKAIDEGMTKCSRFMQGHDQAYAVNEKVVPPNELTGDIDALDEWVKNMRPRRN